ncbi:GDSL-type esterase/lipase family protein [Lentzea sp. BCCO 10_0856]|uniref:GDSL-type esterase/lipase family protein n=1 Tax=Lentzea miocenica TaxID=3095431 RepID=A0ABU4SV62_9PSEU|nr:GDSL-type esterase/lipase family protein [Lentzea sp. BCCO 10_0856]MDX8029794.1 GDSL-type esterase/lipase family protein [Lentzea sp. BCCO 10_0856]
MRVIIALALLLVCGASGVPERSEVIRWLPVWQAVPTLSAGVPDHVVRTTVDLAAGGTSVRVRLSNLMGIKPVRVEQVTIKANGESRELRFNRSRAVTIRARDEVYSDAVQLPVAKTLEITTHTPSGTPCQARAWHTITSARAYTCLVSAVEVAGFTAPGAVVMFGDSITEGYAEGSWPALVESDYAVLNAGIGGNGVVFGDAPMITRLYRDVLYSGEVRKVVMLGGINDIQNGVSAENVIAGIRTVQLRCQNEGVQFNVGTITPWRGWVNWTDLREQQRQKVNAWIRATFPGHVDFDAAVRDPADPLRLRPEFDSGDHLHPNASAFGAMARLVRV